MLRLSFIAELVYFCYESYFMLPLSENNQVDVIEILRYLADLLNIGDPFLNKW